MNLHSVRSRSVSSAPLSVRPGLSLSLLKSFQTTLAPFANFSIWKSSDLQIRIVIFLPDIFARSWQNNQAEQPLAAVEEEQEQEEEEAMSTPPFLSASGSLGLGLRRAGSSPLSSSVRTTSSAVVSLSCKPKSSRTRRAVPSCSSSSHSFTAATASSSVATTELSIAGICRRRGEWQIARSSSTGFEQQQREESEALSSTDFDAEKLDFLQAKFLEADTKGTGKLGASEIRSLLECTDTFCYSLHVMTKEETLEIIKKYDVDGDDKLDFSEFVKFATDKLLLESHLQTYESVFKKLDKDGNGKLDAREVQTLFDTLVQEGSSNMKAMSESEVKSLVEKYSQAGGEGLTFEEFLILGRNVLPEVADVMKYLRMSETATESEAQQKEGKASSKKKKGGAFSGLMNMLGTSLSNNVEIVDKKRWKKKHVNEVKSMEEFQLLLREEKGPIVLEVGFTFCKPCKKFQPKYQLFAEHYDDVLFLMVYGNRNQSCKQLCKTILNVKATPTFYMYSNGSLVDKHVGIKEDPLRKKILALKGN